MGKLKYIKHFKSLFAQKWLGNLIGYNLLLIDVCLIRKNLVGCVCLVVVRFQFVNSEAFTGLGLGLLV